MCHVSTISLKGNGNQMSNVHYVREWATKARSADIRGKMIGLNEFIRSRIAPPPVGSVIFNFKGGKVSLTGNITQITGGDCEVMIQGDNVIMSGCDLNAVDMFVSIHCEIEELRATA
jgi:hypothetical protein